MYNIYIESREILARLANKF